MFEMDHNEAKRLSLKYSHYTNTTFHSIVLYSSDITLTFSVSEDHALNSLTETNHALICSQEFMLREFAQVAKNSVKARSLDSIFASKQIHFLKL